MELPPSTETASSCRVTEEGSTRVFSLLLIAFPGAVALAGMPHVVGLVFCAFLFVAWKFGCLKGFLWTLGVAFVLNFFVVSGFGIYSDVDYYLSPNIRLLAGGGALQPDGYYHVAHQSLPQGFVAWSAALYRLTGWVDAGNMLIFILLPATWCVLRAYLSRVQTMLLIAAPLTFTSIWCTTPDGCVYLLLLTALISLRDRQTFWLPLIALSLACLFKTTAWIPAALIGLVLLRNHPRQILKLLGFACLVVVLVLPTLLALYRGALNEISADFLSMNAAAREMGYFARLAYAYIGHWTTTAQPVFGVPLGGFDGGGADGLMVPFRIVILAAIAVLVLSPKRFKGWGEILLIAWGSVLVMPTLYIGYSRYVPLLYVAGMLPLILRFPRLSILPAVMVCAMPLGWVGWRVMLSTENITVFHHAEAVHSDLYNLRSAYRSQCVDTPQATLSGSLVYTYSPIEEFPAMPRATDVDHRATPAPEKARAMATYATTEWLPWLTTHAHLYLYDVATYRLKTFLSFPRGASDGVPTPHP